MTDFFSLCGPNLQYAPDTSKKKKKKKKSSAIALLTCYGCACFGTAASLDQAAHAGPTCFVGLRHKAAAAVNPL